MSTSWKWRNMPFILLKYPKIYNILKIFNFQAILPIGIGNFFSAIWDTSHWNFFVKFGLKTLYDIS